MRFYDLVVSPWRARFMGREFGVAIGHGGIGVKAGEGDGVTPRGSFAIEQWFMRVDRGLVDGKSIHPRWGWCDAPDDVRYNQLVICPYAASHERLYRADHLYDLIGVLDFNRRPIEPGAGSAIFLHNWRRPRFPTEGCVALAPRDLCFVAAHWRPDSRVVIQ